MHRIRIAVGPLPPRFESYLRGAPAVELLDAAQKPIRRRVLRKLRRIAGDEFTFSLSAPDVLMQDPLDIAADSVPEGCSPRDAGFLRDTPTNNLIFAEFAKEIEALSADFVHFRSPSAFAPSPQNRANLVAFAKDKLAPLGRQVVWEPRGLWTLDEARELAEELGWIIAVDPFVDFEFPMPSATASSAYIVLHAPRGKRMFSIEDFDEVADYIRAHDHDVFVTFRGPDRHRNAAAFKRIFEDGTFEFEGPWMTTAMAQRVLMEQASQSDGEWEYIDDDEE
jgi:uncharacterized protein YecE (DUF72 family)